MGETAITEEQTINALLEQLIKKLFLLQVSKG